MWNPFKRMKSVVKPRMDDPYEYIGGMEPDLDEYALKYREERITEIMELAEKSRESATELADRWFIMTVNSSVGGEPSRKRYVPRPVWDDDWMWRSMFDTREEALEHIASKKGKLLASEHGNADTA